MHQYMCYPLSARSSSIFRRKMVGCTRSVHSSQLYPQISGRFSACRLTSRNYIFSLGLLLVIYFLFVKHGGIFQLSNYKRYTLMSSLHRIIAGFRIILSFCSYSVDFDTQPNCGAQTQQCPIHLIGLKIFVQRRCKKGVRTCSYVYTRAQIKQTYVDFSSETFFHVGIV